MSGRYWSDIVGRLQPYVPGEQPQQLDLVKLNTNENPYGPSPAVLAAIRQQADASLRLYPPPESDRLRESIARYHRLQVEQVFVGNGSDEVLAHCFRALLEHPLPLLFPDITYSFYPVYCGLFDIPFRTIPLAADFSIRVEDYAVANGGIVIANPNAPTGCLLPLSDIRRLLDQNPDSVVVIDEAYIDFGGDTAIGLVDRFENLLVVQTLSKSRSLAGLRVGLAVGNPNLVEALNRVKNSFNSYPLDSLAIAGGSAAFADEEYFETTRQRIIGQRRLLVRELEARNLEVLPSAANFLMTRHPVLAGADLALALREQGVLVRHFSKARIADYVRITVGSEEQNRALLDALDRILQSITG